MGWLLHLLTGALTGRGPDKEKKRPEGAPTWESEGGGWLRYATGSVDLLLISALQTVAELSAMYVLETYLGGLECVGWWPVLQTADWFCYLLEHNAINANHQQAATIDKETCCFSLLVMLILTEHLSSDYPMLLSRFLQTSVDHLWCSFWSVILETETVVTSHANNSYDFQSSRPNAHDLLGCSNATSRTLTMSVSILCLCQT